MADRASAAVSKGTANPDPLIGRVIGGRFRVTALIARGGMGKVYRAEQAPLGRSCAIKILSAGDSSEHDPEFHKRFFLEASVASKLTHPNTVTIFDYGRTEDDIYYMAMEYLEGHTLHRAIREAGALPEARAAHIARQICRALREAHLLGVIHRDLKPANVFLVDHGDQADFVKVLDFGLVKNVTGEGEDLTQTGMFMGSPKYMAPEQIRGDQVDARTDIYALGVILYEMLTGKVPFDRPNSVNILMAHVSDEPPPMREANPGARMSREIEETVVRCLAKDPNQRFASMEELLASLSHGSTRALVETPAALSGLEATERARIATPEPSRSGAALRSPIQRTHGGASASCGEEPALERSRRIGAQRATLGVFVLAAAAATGYGALRFGRSVAPAERPPVASAATATGIATGMVTSPAETSRLAPSAPPAPTAAVRMQIATDPDGASVKENGIELCASTPCELVYDGKDADPLREHKLTFARPGYRVELRTVKTSDGPVHVKLTPAPRAAAAPSSSLKDPGDDMPPRVPPGYKADIPY